MTSRFVMALTIAINRLVTKGDYAKLNSTGERFFVRPVCVEPTRQLEERKLPCYPSSDSLSNFTYALSTAESAIASARIGRHWLGFAR